MMTAVSLFVAVHEKIGILNEARRPSEYKKMGGGAHA